MESLTISNKLVLINRPDDPHPYYSRAYTTTSTPDLAIATEDLQSTSTREVCSQHGVSDYRPVIIHLNQEMKDMQQQVTSQLKLYKRSTGNCSSLVEGKYRELMRACIVQNVALFNKAILEAAKITLPRLSPVPGSSDLGCLENCLVEQCDILEKKVSEARGNMEKHPTDVNVATHNKERGGVHQSQNRRGSQQL